MHQYKCDKCGTTAESKWRGSIPDGWQTVRAEISSPAHRPPSVRTFDFCPDCAISPPHVAEPSVEEQLVELIGQIATEAAQEAVADRG